jgi:hypothetical protein
MDRKESSVITMHPFIAVMMPAAITTTAGTPPARTYQWLPRRCARA